MNTFKGEKTIFNFNSDFSGKVRIKDIETDKEIWIDGKDILKLVAYEYIQVNQIAEIEDKNYKEIFNEFKNALINEERLGHILRQELVKHANVVQMTKVYWNRGGIVRSIDEEKWENAFKEYLNTGNIEQLKKL